MVNCCLGNNKVFAMRDVKEFLESDQEVRVDIVVPVSGGKDSQACLKLAVSQGVERVIGLFCDTSFEHPWTYRHVEGLSEKYGVEILKVCAGKVEDLVVQQGRFPSGTARFCTDQLKIIPSKLFYKALAEKQDTGFEVWYGVRSNESRERENCVIMGKRKMKSISHMR